MANLVQEVERSLEGVLWLPLTDGASLHVSVHPATAGGMFVYLNAVGLDNLALDIRKSFHKKEVFCL